MMKKSYFETISHLDLRKKIEEFLAKYGEKLQAKNYKINEVVRREGEKSQMIYIVKNGIFSISKLENMESETIIAFCRSLNFIVPVSALVPNFPSLYEIRSIENNLANPNSIYEISMKQWNELAENDESLRGLLNAMLYDNLTSLFKRIEILRKNRNMKDLIYELYFSKHWLLNSGISEHYIADSLAISDNFLRRTLNEINYNRDEERFEKIKTKLNI